MIPIEIINLLNKALPCLPFRKTTSKINYCLYLLCLEDNKYYVGYTNNMLRRINEHNKCKSILSYHILFNCNSKANIKICETFLILNIKLFHKDYNLLNKRSESNQY